MGLSKLSLVKLALCIWSSPSLTRWMLGDSRRRADVISCCLGSQLCLKRQVESKASTKGQNRGDGVIGANTVSSKCHKRGWAWRWPVHASQTRCWLPLTGASPRTGSFLFTMISPLRWERSRLIVFHTYSWIASLLLDHTPTSCESYIGEQSVIKLFKHQISHLMIAGPLPRS